MTITPNTHGGRRPGAGAPKNNLNALTHGLNSRRFYAAALMVAAVPELRDLFHTLEAAPTRRERQAYFDGLATIYRATLTDPELAKTIKALVVQRVTERLSQIRVPNEAA